MKTLSRSDGLDAMFRAGSTLYVTEEDCGHGRSLRFGCLNTRRRILHSHYLREDVPIDTVIVAELDADQCAELGIGRGIGCFMGKAR